MLQYYSCIAFNLAPSIFVRNRAACIIDTLDLGWPKASQEKCEIRFKIYISYIKTTLVYLINVLHNLLFFLKKSSLHTFIPSCTFIDFWNILAENGFHSSNFWKIPTCTASFHPACLLILENFLEILFFIVLNFWKIQPAQHPCILRPY